MSCLPYETIVSAELSFFTLGVADGETQIPGSYTDVRLFVDGVEVDGAFDDLDQIDPGGSRWIQTAGFYSISIPESLFSALLDGKVEVTIEFLQRGDAFAIDFSELTIVVRTP